MYKPTYHFTPTLITFEKLIAKLDDVTDVSQLSDIADELYAVKVELEDHLTELQEGVDEGDSKIYDLESQVENLESEIIDLENELSELK